MSWYWHQISDEDSARYATHPAVWVSYFIAVTSASVGVLSILLRRPIAGLNGWALVDAILFLIVGWRIALLSRTWAVIGLSLFLLEVITSFVDRMKTANLAPPIIAIIFVTTYINAVRGAFAYHKYLKVGPQ